MGVALATVLVAGVWACSPKANPSGKGKEQAVAWTPVKAAAYPKDMDLQQEPSSFQAWQLNMDQWKKELGMMKEPRSKSDTVMLPQNDGTLKAYSIRMANTMSPELQAKFPNIRAWSGKALDGSGLRVKLNIDDKSFRAMIQVEGGFVLVEPAFKDSQEWYMAFRKNDLPANSDRNPSAPERK